MSSRDDDRLVAPTWFVWVGVPFALVAALIFALHGGTDRTGGLVLSIAAMIMWSIGVLVGAMKVRRRSQPRPRWLPFVVVMFVFVAVELAFAVHDRDLVLHAARLVAAAVLGFATGAMVVNAGRILFRRHGHD